MSGPVKREYRRGYGDSTDYDIRMNTAGSVTMFTWYKGHPFEGWRSNEIFRKAEADGVLSWDADSNPVIKA